MAGRNLPRLILYLPPAAAESTTDISAVCSEMVKDIIESTIGGMSGNGWGS